MFMHLTNYAIQNKSEAFAQNCDLEDDSAHKRSLTSILQLMEQTEQGFSGKEMMLKIEDIVVKTVIAGQPALQHAYRSCQPEDFENSLSF